MCRCFTPLLLVCLLCCSSQDEDSQQPKSPPTQPSGSEAITPENYGLMRDLIVASQRAAHAAREREKSGLLSTCNRAAPCSADESGLHKAIESSKTHFERCFAAWQTLNPKIKNPSIEFHLSPTGETPPRGQITQIRIQSQGMGNPFFRGCLIAAISDLYFEAPKTASLKLLTKLDFAPNRDPHDHH